MGICCVTFQSSNTYQNLECSLVMRYPLVDSRSTLEHLVAVHTRTSSHHTLVISCHMISDDWFEISVTSTLLLCTPGRYIALLFYCRNSASCLKTLVTNTVFWNFSIDAIPRNCCGLHWSWLRQRWEKQTSHGEWLNAWLEGSYTSTLLCTPRRHHLLCILLQNTHDKRFLFYVKRLRGTQKAVARYPKSGCVGPKKRLRGTQKAVAWYPKSGCVVPQKRLRGTQKALWI